LGICLLSELDDLESKLGSCNWIKMGYTPTLRATDLLAAICHLHGHGSWRRSFMHATKKYKACQRKRFLLKISHKQLGDLY
jgi:hypothetical protein